jgi:hypothetical protein
MGDTPPAGEGLTSEKIRAMSQETDRFAYRQGLFVMAQIGSTVPLLSDDRFQPRR